MACVREPVVVTPGPAIAAARTPEPVPFGLKDGRLYEPLQVERGLACSCTCPGCGARLVAKHAPSGKVRPHFAHDKESDCTTGRETALHLAAKQLIEDRKTIFFPPLDVIAKGRVGRLDERICTESVVRAELRELTKVVPESLLGRTRPDLLVTCGGQEVIVEIAVTHFVDDHKKTKLAALCLPAIEVDLADLRDFTFNEVAKRLFCLSEHAYWVFHPDKAEAEDKVSAALRQLLDEDALVWERQEQKRRSAETAREQARQNAAKRREVALREKEVARNAKAAAFRQLPNQAKLTKVACYIGVSERELPEFLSIPVRSFRSIQAPLKVWQSAVFAAFVFDAAAKGRMYLTSDEVIQWLRLRFVVDEAGGNPAVAVWDYLQGLEERGLLWRMRKQSFAVSIAGWDAAVQVAIESRTPGHRPQVWNETWHDRAVVGKVAHIFGEQYGNTTLWERVVGLLPTVRDAKTPEEMGRYYGTQCRANSEVLRKFFLSAGFTRLA